MKAEITPAQEYLYKHQHESRAEQLKGFAALAVDDERKRIISEVEKGKPLREIVSLDPS